jgi:hypothetical protein
MFPLMLVFYNIIVQYMLIFLEDSYDEITAIYQMLPDLQPSIIIDHDKVE